MSLKKFKLNEVFTNTMKLHPACNFIIYDTKVIYNNVPHQSGARNDLVRNVSSSKGYISLYEYNIDRPEIDVDRIIGRAGLYSEVSASETKNGAPLTILKDNGRIYPWISKDSARSTFKTAFGFETGNKTDWSNEFIYGDVLVGTYPLQAAISREYITSSFVSTSGSMYNPHYVALRNKLDYYSVMSRHYKVNSIYGNKDLQDLNLISIPSIFYGTQIKPGTISLKWYLSGSLQGELQDISQNGELIQVGPAGSTGSGSVAGVALYNDGILLLTGAWALNPVTFNLDEAGKTPSWLHFGAGANDSSTRDVAPTPSASFTMDFKGTNETQVMTMFTHAKSGEINYSTNPTFLKYGQDSTFYTSSAVYEENSELELKNIASSSYSDYSASFERQVYISRIGVYDKNKNLIAVATLSNPVLKKEAENISFKLKLDI